MKMMQYVEIALLVCLVALAIVTIEAKKLRRAVIYMGAFSLLSSFIYLLYNAPDVAIAEACIGCTISVVLFLTALKKYKIITIYYVKMEGEISRESELSCVNLLQDLETFLLDNDFEPQLVKTNLYDTTLHEKEDFDLLVVNSSLDISIYSAKSNYHTPLIGKYIDDYAHKKNLVIDFISLKEDADYEG